MHDLTALAREVQRTYFPDTALLPIRWGKNSPQRKRRSIRLGSYDHSTTIIRIHPTLDAAHVPAFFIQSIIHHEYLHHVLGPPHNARFHRFERKFRFHRESKEWLKLNLPVLLGRKKQVRATTAILIAARNVAAAVVKPVQLRLFG